VTSVFASVGILVIGWQIGAATAAQTATLTPQASSGTAGGSTGGSTTTGTSAAPAPASPTTTAPTTTTAAADGTYTGSSVNTRFGSVQVQVTVSGGAITDVTALHLTDADGRSVQISDRAAPVLHDEVLASQSANVSNVSGATYTTQAYLSSVQSALDQAGL
jgi:uncharacterized protein with FMN-binding domain